MKTEDLAMQIAAYYFVIAILIIWFGLFLIYLLWYGIAKLIEAISKLLRKL